MTKLELDTEQRIEAPKAELVNALPGASELDQQLLDQVVSEVNRLYAVKGLETARAIGEYVLSQFFDHDPNNFQKRGGDHVTFRELADRDDLFVSHVWIWRAVSVVDQLRLLPDDIAAALPYTHHTILLPLRDQKKKVKLARRAAEGAWPKRKLQAEVDKARQKEKSSRGGRPPLPRFQKTVNKFHRLLKEPDLAFGDLDKIEEIDAQQAKELAAIVTQMKEQCEAMEQRLLKRLAAVG